MPDRDSVAEFVRQVEDGRFVEAMERFYAADATAQENGDTPRVGLPALIAHERMTLAAFERIEARCLSPVLVDGDAVVIHWEFVFHHAAGKVLRLEELAQQIWRGNRLASERFFYDSRQVQR